MKIPGFFYEFQTILSATADPTPNQHFPRGVVLFQWIYFYDNFRINNK
jgi:hypothetical protein